MVRASVLRLINDEVFADSVAVEPQALQDALQTQIDLGNLAQVPADSSWIDVQWADQQAAKRY